jgi:hypothetical protein
VTVRLRHLAAAAGAAALLAGCGSDDDPKGKGIPADAVAAIEQRLDEVQRRFDDATQNDNPGACEDIESDSFAEIDRRVTGLPSDVDPDVRDALESSLERLRQLTQEGCADVEPAQTDTTPEETIPQETVTETVPEETTPPPEPETEPQQTAPQGRGPDGQGPPGQGGGGAVPPSDEEGD